MRAGHSRPAPAAKQQVPTRLSLAVNPVHWLAPRARRHNGTSRLKLDSRGEGADAGDAAGQHQLCEPGAALEAAVPMDAIARHGAGDAPDSGTVNRDITFTGNWGSVVSAALRLRR